jgi:hypothetical protein
MEAKLQTLFKFPDSIPRSSSEDSPITFAYTLRGIVIDQNLTFFSEWEHYTNPFQRTLKWYKSDFSSKHEVVSVDQGEVLTIARERGNQGVLTIYIKDDVPEAMDRVLPPEYLQVLFEKMLIVGICSKR